MDLLTPADNLNYPIENYANGYEDHNGRVMYVLALLRDRRIDRHRIPLLDPDSKKTEFSRDIDFSYLLPKKKEKPVEECEQPVQAPVSKIVYVTNPRWEHKKVGDESVVDKDEESEGDASIGDTVILMADIKNCPEGAEVVFDIYDMSVNPPKRIDSAKGKHNKGLGKGEWVVTNASNSSGELKFAFEATARSKSSSRSTIPLLQKIQCDFVEMPDLLFNHNSAVSCLDSEGILIGSVAAAFIYTKNSTGREAVLFGHSDTSGDPAYNYDLSGWRAEGIKAIIDNDSETFLDIVDLASKVEDYQAILKSLAGAHGYTCDPGKVDNVAGDKTKEALKIFQSEYNERFNGNLKVDGVIGPKTWTAMFTVIRSFVEEIVKAECGEMPAIEYGFNGKGIYPCGESFPVDEAQKDNYKSKSNRRVEIVFCEKGKAPVINEPEDKKKIKKTEVSVYDSRKVNTKPIPKNVVKFPEVIFNVKGIIEDSLIDKYEEITNVDLNMSESKELPIPRYDYISLKINKTILVEVIVKDVELAEVYFVSSDESVCKPSEEHPSSSPFYLELKAGSVNDGLACIEARCGDTNGRILGMLWITTYKEITYKAKVFGVVDSKSSSTTMSKTFTAVDLSNNISAHFKPGQITWLFDVEPKVNVEFDLNKNGALDIEPGTDSEELKKIMDSCLVEDGVARVIVVKKLRWNFYLAKDVDVSDTEITLKKYHSTLIGYFGRKTYRIEDDKGNGVNIDISSVDSAKATITLSKPIGQKFAVVNKPALLFSLGGLSGNPTLISESDIPNTTALLNTVGHELGHTCGGLKDVCEVGNIMYGIVQTAVPPLKLRKRGLKLFYNPTKREEQWSQLKRS